MRRLIATALVIAGAVVTARATVLAPASLADLSRDATAIVRGRVVAVESRWTGDRRAIETVVTLRAESYLKGDLGPTLRFAVPGGVFGRYRSVIVGAPGFAVDESVIVFLAGQAPAMPFVVGFNQGVYRIVSAPVPSGGRRSAVVARGGGALADRDRSTTPLPVDAFERRVRSLVETAK